MQITKDSIYTVKSQNKNTMIFVDGTFDGATVNIGFTYEGEYYTIPSDTPHTSGFMIPVYYGYGMSPSIQVTGSGVSTDLTFIATGA